MKKLSRWIAVCLCSLVFTGLAALRAEAAPLDEILNYTITVDVNEDATLNMKYHIEWLVLDSDSEGPLEWVQIGTPNNHSKDYIALSDTIKSISHISSGGSYAKITLKQKYYEGQKVSFDFQITQDYMYEMNRLEDGYTTYELTPGWFDDIAVDNLTVYWNSDKLHSWTPGCEIDKGYHSWTVKLKPGEKTRICVTYPNDAFAFAADKYVKNNGSFQHEGEILALVSAFTIGLAAIITLVGLANQSYREHSGLGAYQTEVTRTRIEYHRLCPSCGGVRKAGEDYCQFCGNNMVKSKEVLSEIKVRPEDQEAMKHDKEGLYPYSAIPNTYVRVNVTKTPRRSGTTRSGRSRSSCAHSSCACACACACAGGGRAGCSAKNFYRTGLKLRQLERRSGKK